MSKIGLSILDKVSLTKKIFEAKKVKEKTKVVQSVFDSDSNLALEPSEDCEKINIYDGSAR